MILFFYNIALLAVLVAGGAIVLQLSPKVGLVDPSQFPIPPVALLLLMLATGPLVYGVGRLWTLRPKPAA